MKTQQIVQKLRSHTRNVADPDAVCMAVLPNHPTAASAKASWVYLIKLLLVTYAIWEQNVARVRFSSVNFVDDTSGSKYWLRGCNDGLVVGNTGLSWRTWVQSSAPTRQLITVCGPSSGDLTPSHRHKCRHTTNTHKIKRNFKKWNEPESKPKISLFCFIFRDRVLWVPDWPGVHYVDQSGLKLSFLPASASRVPPHPG